MESISSPVRMALNAEPPSSGDLAQLSAAVFTALREGTAAQAIGPMEMLCARHPKAWRCWWLLGLLLREEQRHEAALAAIDRARALAPQDGDVQALAAQIRYETGRDAAQFFAEARTARPDDLALVRGHAGALMAEGRAHEGEALMHDSLTRAPGWVEGQTYRATLRLLRGVDDHDEGFAQAVRAHPENLALRLGWFHWRAKCRDWDGADRIVAGARRDFGDRPALLAAALYLAAESGGSDDPALFDAVQDRGDPGIDLARVRHALRLKDAERAAAIALAHIGKGAARVFWPYLSIAWRLTGDRRAQWLDRPDTLIQVGQLGLGRSELGELAVLLRSLHAASAPYPDQSVRGGTQTDRPLLFRHDPVMRRTREAIEEGVRDYVAQLPAYEEGHPLLGLPRRDLRFAGSWSVRLASQGYHACHTHPAGWISSALYVSLPDEGAMGAPPAGWLRFGGAPPELGLHLPHVRDVKPREGQLVLFPSTLWHGTLPFADGERLSIAFDIAPPRY